MIGTVITIPGITTGTMVPVMATIIVAMAVNTAMAAMTGTGTAAMTGIIPTFRTKMGHTIPSRGYNGPQANPDYPQ